jgi:predicted RNase H-like HicB family nuclease
MRRLNFRHREDGYWLVECPSLPGCISQGETKEEALANINEAIEQYIELLEDEGRPVPEDVGEDDG